MKNSITLIIPPSPFLLDERVFVPLGILKVAASLEDAGYLVDMLDLSGVNNYIDVVETYLLNSTNRTFGITATTPQMPAAANIAKKIKELNGASKIILGGPHATLVAAAYKREVKLNIQARADRAMKKLLNIYDHIVAGDGEHAIFAALEEGAPAIIDADDRRSQYFIKRGELDKLSYPARHLIDMHSYRYKVDNYPATSLIAQLGCPFECGFCAGRLSPMLRHIRTRSSENIVEEMVQLYKTYGYTGFMFYDDELNVNKNIVDLMTKIVEAQEVLGVEWRLRGFVKAELFTEEQAAVMYKAGFRWLLVGFESGSPKILDTIKKRATREDNSKCLDIAKKYGMKVKALMSLGHPGESFDTVRETKEWLLDKKPDDFDVTIITPYPGSPYYDMATKTDKSLEWVYTASNGDTLYQQEVDYTVHADYYKGDPDDGYVSYVYTDYLSSQQLIEERDKLEKEVRATLNIPFNPGAASILYEHSMGQSSLPQNLLRASNEFTSQHAQN